MNHLTTKRRHTTRNLQTRQLAHRRSRKPIHAIRAHLERQLTAIEHSALERVRFILQIGLGALAGRQKVFEKFGQKAFADGRLDKIVFYGVSEKVKTSKNKSKNKSK